MSSDLRKKIEAEILNGFWADIEPHVERDAAFLIDPDLDLVDVALKIASDDVTVVGKWIESGMVKRPDRAQTQAWSATTGKAFRFVIVQPYVLMQELGH